MIHRITSAHYVDHHLVSAIEGIARTIHIIQVHQHEVVIAFIRVIV